MYVCMYMFILLVILFASIPKYHNQTSKFNLKFSVINATFTLDQEHIRTLLDLVSYVSMTQGTHADQQAKV
jgi:hypothetical protein